MIAHFILLDIFFFGWGFYESHHTSSKQWRKLNRIFLEFSTTFRFSVSKSSAGNELKVRSCKKSHKTGWRSESEPKESTAQNRSRNRNCTRYRYIHACVWWPSFRYIDTNTCADADTQLQECVSNKRSPKYEASLSYYYYYYYYLGRPSP